MEESAPKIYKKRGGVEVRIFPEDMLIDMMGSREVTPVKISISQLKIPIYRNQEYQKPHTIEDIGINLNVNLSLLVPIYIDKRVISSIIDLCLRGMI